LLKIKHRYKKQTFEFHKHLKLREIETIDKKGREGRLRNYSLARSKVRIQEKVSVNESRVPGHEFKNDRLSRTGSTIDRDRCLVAARQCEFAASKNY
jgi:hypothetical protein